MKEPDGDRNKRGVIRTDNPFKRISPPVVAVNMPGLTDHPLGPENFNEAGFRAHLPVPGELGAVYPLPHSFLRRDRRGLLRPSGLPERDCRASPFLGGGIHPRNPRSGAE